MRIAGRGCGYFFGRYRFALTQNEGRLVQASQALVEAFKSAFPAALPKDDPGGLPGEVEGAGDDIGRSFAHHFKFTSVRIPLPGGTENMRERLDPFFQALRRQLELENLEIEGALPFAGPEIRRFADLAMNVHFIDPVKPEEMVNVPTTPGSLEAALAALRADHEFLLRGDVFTPDVIDTWIWYKTEREVDELRLRPHPYEFCLYADI